MKKVIGIICEYNPFHNGHLYHINKIKEMYPNSIIILVLNGYFLERGEISIISKQNKTKIALKNNIDLIIELPFVFGTQSADTFANVSITLLENFKCDYVIFGSECNDLETLEKITDFTINNKEYDLNVKNYLNKGLNYPTALSKAINIPFKFNSNDLLGISYIKSIKLNKFNIKPLTIKRTNNYLDTLSNEDIISASNIRKKIDENKDIKKFVPKETTKYIEKIDLNIFFTIIKHKIITEKDLSIYLDVDEGIEYRLKKIILNCNSINELIEKIKTKRYTYNKIKRMLIHILIGLTKEDNKKLELDYIKILGFNNTGKNYLNSIKKDINISITPNKKSLVYDYEKKATIIYDMLTNQNNFEFENSKKPIFLSVDE